VISALDDAEDLRARAQAARAYAETNFSTEAFAGSFDRLLGKVAANGTDH
jgi:hypothetical protein